MLRCRIKAGPVPPGTGMINKKWITAGYAAALISIILVFLLLGAAFLTERTYSAEQKDSGTARNAEAGRSEADGSAETGSGEADGPAHAGENDADKYADGGDREDAPQQSFVKEQTEMLSDAMDRAEYEAQILTLEGKDLWSRFDGAVLTGDSRIVGFSLYTGIPDASVLARNGATIEQLDGYVAQIAALKPQRVYIAYGINDIKSAVGGKTAESYAHFAEGKIKKLEEALDDTEIYVNSILPVSPALEERDRDYRKVTDYNAELRAMCDRNGWHYIDNSIIAYEYADLYVSDGVHLQAGFYEHWGRNMLLADSGA